MKGNAASPAKQSSAAQCVGSFGLLMRYRATRAKRGRSGNERVSESLRWQIDWMFGEARHRGVLDPLLLLTLPREEGATSPA